MSSLLGQVTESGGGVAFDQGRDVELKGHSGRHRTEEAAWE